ncbi:hypothetical protein NQZ68_013553, partial [Dissostichus eleginoides]
MTIYGEEAPASPPLSARARLILRGVWISEVSGSQRLVRPEENAPLSFSLCLLQPDDLHLSLGFLQNLLPPPLCDAAAPSWTLRAICSRCIREWIIITEDPLRVAAKKSIYNQHLPLVTRQEEVLTHTTLRGQSQ